MGRAEGPHEVSFSDEDSWTVRKKVGYVLAFLAVASCIVVGLLVYYVGVMGIKCDGISPGGQTGSGGLDAGGLSGPKKEKVTTLLFKTGMYYNVPLMKQKQKHKKYLLDILCSKLLNSAIAI
jgi:hypothetical protein